MKRYPKICLCCSDAFTTPAKKLMYCSPFCNVEHRLASLSLPADQCWEWPGAREQSGYGQIRWNGRLRKAHRLAHGAFKGPIPRGMVVMHSCDNPSCCNPSHLNVGTQLDNMADMTMKKRYVAPQSKLGEDHHEARLTRDDIPNIRQKVSAGKSMRSVAREFNVTHNAIRRIIHRETWKHVP
jgi:hypothetical protein